MNKALLHNINQAFDRRHLENGIYVLAKQFCTRSEHKKILLSKDISFDFLKLYSDKALSKSELVILYAAFFSDDEILQAFHIWLPIEVRKILDALTWQDSLSEQNILKKYNINIRDEKTKQLRTVFRLFQIKEHYKWRKQGDGISYTLSLPTELRRILSAFAQKPKSYKLIPISKPHPTHFVYKGEELIFQELPHIISYYGENSIKISKSNSPIVSSIRKMQKALNLEIFYKSPKELDTLKGELIISLLMHEEVHKLPTDTLRILQQLMTTYTSKFQTIFQLLTHLRGMANLDTKFTHKVEKTLFRFLKELPQGEWIGVDNALDYMAMKEKNIQPVPPSVAAFYLYFANSSGRDYIAEELYHKALLRPTFTGTLFLFGALGLVDLAYNNIDLTKQSVSYFSFYDGLEYIRLTPLGAYLSGKNPTYSIPKSIEIKSYRLSKDSLIITVDEADKVASSILANYTEKTGNVRYRTNAQIFLKSCETKGDVRLKIKLFKRIVGENIPENWTKFLERLLTNCDPLTKIEDTVVFQLPQNKAFVRLMVSDDILKKLIIKAEGFHIIVKRKDIPTFKNQLKKLGYLLGE